MNHKILFAILLIIVVSSGVFFLWTQQSRNTNNVISETPIEHINIHRFTNASGDFIEASFNPESKTVTVTGNGYVGMVFNETVSASGARYENKENNLVLWNKGNEVTLYQGEEEVFAGTVAASTVEPLPEPANNNPSEMGVSKSELDASSWVWTHTDLSGGERVTAPGGKEFLLKFDGNGSVTSSTDCNGLGGVYQVNGEVLSMGQFVTTLMFCEGSMEGEYIEQLGLVSSYVIEGDTLRLNLNRDYGVMTFVRSN